MIQFFNSTMIQQKDEIVFALFGIFFSGKNAIYFDNVYIFCIFVISEYQYLNLLYFKMEALQTNHYTYEDYLKIEESSELRYEFYHGEIFAMAGTTKRHNKIVFNTTVSFNKKLNGRCDIFSEAVKVRIKEKGHYAYPDVVVSCSEKEDDPLTVKYPILIVEVLSDSTREYDTGKKFLFYKQIKSLKHYILVEQKTCLVTCYTKQNELWIHKSYSELDEIVTIEHLNIDISVKEIYENIIFEEDKKIDEHLLVAHS